MNQLSLDDITLSKEAKDANAEMLTSAVEWAKEQYSTLDLPFEKHEKKLQKEYKEQLEHIWKQIAYSIYLIKDALEYMQATQLPQQNKELFSSIDNILKALKNPPESIQEEQLMDVFHLSWDFMDFAFQLAFRFLDNKEYEKGESVFHFLILLHRDVPDYMLYLAHAQFLQKKYTQAAENYMLFLLHDEEHTDALFNMAYCLYETKEYAMALSVIEKIEKLTQKEEVIELKTRCQKELK